MPCGCRLSSNNLTRLAVASPYGTGLPERTLNIVRAGQRGADDGLLHRQCRSERLTSVSSGSSTAIPLEALAATTTTGGIGVTN